MRRTALALATTLALVACKGDDHPATAPAPVPALPPAPIHVAPPAPVPVPVADAANASVPSDPVASHEAAQRELDRLDGVIAHAQRALDAAHSDRDRIKAMGLLKATKLRRDALAARLQQPVPQQP